MDTQAKIEIRTRDVKNMPSIPTQGKIQHLFVIYTDSSGKEFILRGGPEHGNEFKDNLKIISAPYDEEHKHLFPNDLVKNAPSSTIATGTDFQMKAIFDKMWSRGQEINAGKFDYKIPIPGCPASLCHIQNSNTVISEVLKAAGLEMKLPEVNGKTVLAPGINGDIRHTTIDEITRIFFEYNQDNKGPITNIVYEFISKKDSSQKTTFSFETNTEGNSKDRSGFDFNADFNSGKEGEFKFDFSGGEESQGESEQRKNPTMFPSGWPSKGSDGPSGPAPFMPHNPTSGANGPSGTMPFAESANNNKPGQKFSDNSNNQNSPSSKPNESGFVSGFDVNLSYQPNQSQIPSLSLNL